jgi:conjugative transposon TraN protein
MKRVIFIFCALINVALAQQPLAVSTDKTTSLIFPFPILHVDRGTQDIITLPVKESDNILLVKAATKLFKETNLSVVTGDGNVYQFTVSYSEKPNELVFHLPPSKKASIATYCNSILDNKVSIRVKQIKKENIWFRVIGIYVKDDVLFYQLEIHNHSPIDYDIDLLKFFIRDKKKGKRTSVQENELTPLYVTGNQTKVKAYNFSIIVVAVDKFMIPDAKFLGIQMMEKNGGRNFNLKVYNNQILKAVVLPDLN